MSLLWLRDLQHRRVRSAGVVGIVAIVLTLLFLTTGLVGQFRAEPILAVSNVGGDSDWILPAGTTSPFTSSDTILRSEVDQADAIPVLVLRADSELGNVFVIGRDAVPESVPPLRSGRHPQAEHEIVISDLLTASLGDNLRLGGSDFTVVGTVADASMLAGVPLVFASLARTQESLLADNDVVTGYLVSPEVELILPTSMIRLPADTVGLAGRVPLEDAIASVDLVRSLLWLITAIVVAAVTYISAVDRIREFALFKAVGADGRALAMGLIAQATGVVVAAYLFAGVLQFVARPLFPLGVRLESGAWWQIFAIALLVASVSALAGVRRINSINPQEAFA